MPLISGDEALSEFRKKLTGPRALDLLQEAHGRLLVQLPVGVGKSRWLDEITLAALGTYELVVVLSPTRQLIDERRPLVYPPQGIKVVNIRPRPVKRCGKERDLSWKGYETGDLGALGRSRICGPCPHRQRCFWPDQYGSQLEGARLIYGTQAQLARAPGFVGMLRARTGADRVLTLIDEANFLDATAESVINQAELVRFRDALRAANFLDAELETLNRRWLSLVEMLIHASRRDIGEGEWRFPSPRSDWAIRVQESGVDQFGAEFRFLGYALDQFGISGVETRGRNERNDIEFGSRPWIGDCVIFSGTTDPEFARLRLGKNFSAPFADHQFRHPDSHFFNVANSIGTVRHFKQHSDQILDFFAGLTVKRIDAGKRVLLIAKKCFLDHCASELERRFREYGGGIEVLTGDFSPDRLLDPRSVPLINFGAIGTNLFEEFDCAYCLSGYYINENVLDRCLQGSVRRDLRLPMKIRTEGIPKRRRIDFEPENQFYDVARIANPVLRLKENGTVLQAIGRVRPFTRPREVISFQMGALPGVDFDREFTTLAEAREHFGIPNRREQKRVSRAHRIAELRREGLTQAETAKLLGVSERTIRNHEKGGNRQNSI